MAEPRKVDKLAGTGSLADRLRRQRIAVEAGDPEAAARIGSRNEMPEDAQYGTLGADDKEEDKGITGEGAGKKLRLLKDLLISKKK